VVSLSSSPSASQRREAEEDKKKKIEPSGSIRLNRLYPKPTANHPANHLPFPCDPRRLRRKAKSTGGCRCADRTGCEGCQATFRSLIDHRHGPHPSETIPPPFPPLLPSQSLPRGAALSYLHIARCATCMRWAQCSLSSSPFPSCG